MTKISNFKFQISNLQKGFTLIELLITISIIGILATFLMANYIGVAQRSKDTQRKSDLAQIRSALELYRSDLGSYPTTATFPACGSALTGGGPPPLTYMQKVPCDPMGGSYTYTSDGTSYSIIACLENSNDSQKDTVNANPPCNGTDRFSYTLNNP